MLSDARIRYICVEGDIKVALGLEQDNGRMEHIEVFYPVEIKMEYVSGEGVFLR